MKFVIIKQLPLRLYLVNKAIIKLHCLVFIRGYNMGVRLIEDYLARANTGRCNDFRETADVIAKVRGWKKIDQKVIHEYAITIR